MKKLNSDFICRALFLLFLIAISLVVILPYIWMLSNSFKSTKETLMDAAHIFPKAPTLNGYKRVLFESPFFMWLGNSMMVTITNTLAILFTSSLIGYVFSRYEFWNKKLLFTMMLSTMMVPAQATIIPTFILINAVGLFNSPWALIIPSVFSVFGIYLCKEFIDEIPKELLESAGIDGAGDWQIFFKIVLPQIRPAIGALGIFTFLEHWNDYLRPLIYLNSSEKMTLPLAISFFSTQHSTDLSATMAVSALIMIPVTIVFLLFQRQFVKGISMTGMK
ncbi:MAG: transporter permease [Clostridia bacterium]|jgi:ABC-type glycerol-3-phosphate transport system permease component|nr:transporter permease [Clostridia bacterium]